MIKFKTFKIELISSRQFSTSICLDAPKTPLDIDQISIVSTDSSGATIRSTISHTANMSTTSFENYFTARYNKVERKYMEEIH
jgi:hypothetical protein